MLDVEVGMVVEGNVGAHFEKSFGGIFYYSYTRVTQEY